MTHDVDVLMFTIDYRRDIIDEWTNVIDQVPIDVRVSYNRESHEAEILRSVDPVTNEHIQLDEHEKYEVLGDLLNKAIHQHQQEAREYRDEYLCSRR